MERSPLKRRKTLEYVLILPFYFSHSALRWVIQVSVSSTDMAWMIGMPTLVWLSVSWRSDLTRSRLESPNHSLSPLSNIHLLQGTFQIWRPRSNHEGVIELPHVEEEAFDVFLKCIYRDYYISNYNVNDGYAVCSYISELTNLFKLGEKLESLQLQKDVVKKFCQCTMVSTFWVNGVSMGYSAYHLRPESDGSEVLESNDNRPMCGGLWNDPNMQDQARMLSLLARSMLRRDLYF